MHKLPFAIKEIRNNLEEMQGQPIKVKANMGRSKIFEREGVVHQIHPSLFVVETLEKRSRKARATYQFSDILTGQVELSHPETGEMVFPWLAEEE
jgi:uncharacterized protein Veg